MAGIEGTHPDVNKAMRTAHHGHGKAVIQLHGHKRNSGDAEDRIDHGVDEAKESS